MTHSSTNYEKALYYQPIKAAISQAKMLVFHYIENIIILTKVRRVLQRNALFCFLKLKYVVSLLVGWVS